MDKQEMRDKLMAAINSIIKDGPENPEAMKDAETNLHDVLAAKMRDRIHGSEAHAAEPEDDQQEVDLTKEDQETGE